MSVQASFGLKLEARTLLPKHDKLTPVSDWLTVICHYSAIQMTSHFSLSHS